MVENITDKSSKWKFVGLDNFRYLIFENAVFQKSLQNIAYIFFWGVIAVMIAALLFAIVLNSGVRFKSFFRAVIYLPNIVSAVAMGTMWIHYAMNTQYGLFKKLFGFLGINAIANFTWTEDAHLLFSMTFAYCFGSIGYYMLTYMAAMDKIPKDFYEAATLEGATVFGKFFRITLPLIKGVFKTTITLWTLGCAGFFAWVWIFNNIGLNLNVISPTVLIYNLAFMEKANAVDIHLNNSGTAAAIGIILTLLTLLIFVIVNLLIRDDKYEY